MASSSPSASLSPPPLPPPPPPTTTTTTTTTNLMGLSHCPAGHPLTRVLRTWRERTWRENTRQERSYFGGVIVARFECDTCGVDLHDDFIAKSCVPCDLDFCESCVSSSHSILDLTAHPYLPMAEQQQQQQDDEEHGNGEGIPNATTATSILTTGGNDSISARLQAAYAACSLSGRLFFLTEKLSDERPWEELRGVLLNGPPETIREARLLNGQSPLHIAMRCYRTNFSEIVDTILKADPESPQILDEDGNTPLHLAIQSSMPLEKVSQVTIAYPEAVQIKANDGFTPLLYLLAFGQAAYSSQSFLSLIKFLVEACPKAVQIADNDGEGPLHYVMGSNFPPTILRILLDAYETKQDARNAIIAPTKVDGTTALHHGVRYGASASLIQLLVEACPEAIDVRDSKGRAPSQLASRKINSQVAALIQNSRAKELYSEFPLTKFETAASMTVLHKAMECRASAEKIKLILEEMPPRSTAVKYINTGETPLHIGVRNGAPEDSLFVLMDHFPEAIGVKSYDGDTALIRHLKHEDVSIYVVKKMLELCPAASKIANSYGYLPLHVVMTLRLPFGIFKAILKANRPAAKAQTSHEGMTPLHCGFSTEENEAHPRLECVKALLFNLEPSDLKVLDNAGRSCLRLAIASGAPPSIVEAILDKCSRATGDMEDLEGGGIAESGTTALHEAVRNTSKLDPRDQLRIVKMLLDFAPSAAEIQDKVDNWTPFHLALVQGVDISILHTLYEAFPGVIYLVPGQVYRALYAAYRNKIKIHKGRMDNILHFALRYAATREAVEFLMARDAGAIHGKNGDGHLPLHVAMGKKETRPDALHVVLSAHPEAALVADTTGRTPLHLGIESQAAKENIQLLLQLCPEAAHTFDENGRSPLMLAIRSHCSMEIIKMVFEAHPAATKESDATGKYPLFELVYRFYQSDSQSQTDSIGACTYILTEIVDTYPPAARHISTTGSSAVSILIAECSIAESFDRLLKYDTLVRLRIMMGGLRDGRSFSPFCNPSNPLGFQAFLFLFDERDSLDQAIETGIPHLNLNREMIEGWTLLEILADIDTSDSAQILLQLVSKCTETCERLPSEETMITITSKTGEKIATIHLLSSVSRKRMQQVAGRAKISSFAPLKKWGSEYGRFMRRYLIETDLEPKHISETCVVVFGRELRNSEDQVHEHRVALKFFENEDAFQREIEKRRGVRGDFIVPIQKSYSAVDMVWALPGEVETTGSAMAEELRQYPQITLKGGHDSQNTNRALNFLIVMNSGSGIDLHDFINHQNVAGNDLHVAVSVAKNIAPCLQFLNEDCRILHGDVKARNFVAKGVGLGFAAIDLDCAASIASAEYAGAKRTSSGYLPPEQASIELYLRSKSQCENVSEVGIESLQGEIEKALAEKNYGEVARLYKLCEEAEKKSQNTKPSSVVASSKYDMWCFGVLLYYMFTGRQLFHLDTREDVDDEGLKMLAEWSDSTKNEKLRKIPYSWPKRLVERLLERDPQKRPASWAEIISDLSITGLVSNVGADVSTDAHCFISYSRKNRQELALLYKHLIDNSMPTWTDSELKPGTAEWTREIETALRRANVVVVLCSPGAKASEWVSKEVYYAYNNKVPVLPVLIEGNSEDSVPFTIYDMQYVDARTNFVSTLPYILDRIKDLTR